MMKWIIVIVLILIGAVFSNWIHKYLTFLPSM
jgi:hypothetical protein